MPQEVLHKLRLQGRKAVALRPEAKTSLALQKVKGGKERLVLSSSLHIVLQLLTFCFCEVNYLGFYLTLHHTTKKLQEDHDAAPDHSLRKQESGNGLKCASCKLQTL